MLQGFAPPESRAQLLLRDTTDYKILRSAIIEYLDNFRERNSASATGQNDPTKTASDSATGTEI